MSLLGLSEVEFEPEREVWNAYEMSDGTVLRVRSLLLKLFRSNQTGPVPERGDAYSGRFQTVMNVKRTSAELKGLRTEPRLPLNELQNQPVINEEFTAIDEGWNRYRLETGDLLKVKLVATRVGRIEGGWDEFGDPLYAVSFVNVIQEIKKSQT
jgi:hypothetical protein